MSQTQEIGRDVRQGIRQDIRRRHDGSIDVDFYRARAAALRIQAIRDAFRYARAQFRAPLKQWWMRLVLLPSGR
jgi:plasmid stabilization system protein ParE